MEIQNLKEKNDWKESDVVNKKPNFWNVDFETEDFQTATFCLDYNGNVHRHKHRNEENFWYIVSGKGKVIIDGEEDNVKEGDSLVIPKNVFHEAKTDSENRMRILQISAKTQK